MLNYKVRQYILSNFMYMYSRVGTARIEACGEQYSFDLCASA